MDLKRLYKILNETTVQLRKGDVVTTEKPTKERPIEAVTIGLGAGIGLACLVVKLASAHCLMMANRLHLAFFILNYPQKLWQLSQSLPFQLRVIAASEQRQRRLRRLALGTHHRRERFVCGRRKLHLQDLEAPV